MCIILSDILKAEIEDEIPSSSLRDRRLHRRSGESRQNVVNSVELLEAVQNTCLSTQSNEDSPVYITRQELQSEQISEDHVLFYGFDTLFPGSNLGEVFDQERTFRTAMRMAAREDFYISDSALTDEVRPVVVEFFIHGAGQRRLCRSKTE